MRSVVCVKGDWGGETISKDFFRVLPAVVKWQASKPGHPHPSPLPEGEGIFDIQTNDESATEGLLKSSLRVV